MGMYKRLSDFDKGPVVMARWLGQSLLLGVSGMQWLVPFKSSSRNDNQQSSDRVIGAQSSLICGEQRLACLVWSHRTTVAQIFEKRNTR